MKRWHLPSLTGSSDKQTEREPGSTAPRTQSVGRQKPRVLFSSPECRAVVLDLADGEELGDHQVRERALIHVLRGSVTCTSGTDTAICEEGTLIVFEPGEPHSVRALQPTRLLLTLAPWPAEGHYDDALGDDPHELPVNATQQPHDDRNS